MSLRSFNHINFSGMHSYTAAELLNVNQSFIWVRLALLARQVPMTCDSAECSGQSAERGGRWNVAGLKPPARSARWPPSTYTPPDLLLWNINKHVICTIGFRDILMSFGFYKNIRYLQFFIDFEMMKTSVRLRLTIHRNFIQISALLIMWNNVYVESEFGRNFWAVE